MLGVYEQPIEGWIGQIQSALSDEFSKCEGEHGFLIEAIGLTPAIQAMSLPFVDGEEHKRTIARVFKHSAPFISVARDHGSGAEPSGDEVRLPDSWLTPMHQHQDSEEDGQGSAFDRVGDKLASGGHDGGHEAVELLVLEGEPQVGGEGVERLEADQPTEDEGLAQPGVEA